MLLRSKYDIIWWILWVFHTQYRIKPKNFFFFNFFTMMLLYFITSISQFFSLNFLEVLFESIHLNVRTIFYDSFNPTYTPINLKLNCIPIRNELEKLIKFLQVHIHALTTLLRQMKLQYYWLGMLQIQEILSFIRETIV